MNEGVLFYWIMWMGWVFSTFLMKRNPFRSKLAFLFLFGIILSGHSISFPLGKINAAFILFLGIGFVYAVKNQDHLIHHLVSSFIVATAYVSLQLFALYDPVKLIVDKKYLLIIVLMMVLLIISKRNYDILFIYFIGLFIGDSLFQLLIYRLQGYVDIGSDYVMDLLAITSFILIISLSSAEVLKKMRKASYKKSSSAKQI
ncbi:YphA family membrane protein [Fictibacillus barbaricus]|uniref:Uncharacterized protein n=1 Tax=Fictibacillus barbaricus TaxID=182136 RepID=A0ABU1TZA2_9BACL|nr:hypothetical protein [Fictibacillus barbaricus]MDR7072557.1 hypothetical protein [Fictibacillus barbaricus]